MLYVLDLPWGDKTEELKAQYGLSAIKGGYFVYSGALLPQELRTYVSEDFGYCRWLEDERNATVMPPEKYGENFVLHPHQQEAASKIFEAYENGFSGFLEADRRNAGKTLSSLSGITQIAKENGYSGRSKGKLLIVTSKGLVEKWRNVIHHYPVSTAMLRVLVITYPQLSKLLIAPPQARISQKKSLKVRVTAKNGIPATDWDFVIFDEAQLLKDYHKNAYAKEAAAVAKLNQKYYRGKSPFVIFNSSKPGDSPLDFALMANFMGPLIDPTKRINEVFPNNWVEFLKQNNFSITDGRYGPIWGKDVTPQKLNGERRKLARALMKENAPFINRKLENINKAYQYTYFPLELSASTKNNYKNVWENLRESMVKTQNDAERIEIIGDYRRRTSYMKNNALLDVVFSYAEKGQPIYLRIENEDAASEMQVKIEKKKLSCGLIGSETTIDEEKKLWSNFENGSLRVLISNKPIKILEGTAKTLRKDFAPYIFIYDLFYDHNLESEINLLFKKTYSNFVYFPYFRKTFEEDLLQKFDNKIPEFTKEELIKTFRTLAAKRIPRGRLS